MNDHDDNMLGGLEDVGIEDQSPLPGADIFCDNDVSDIFWMENILPTYRYSTLERSTVQLRWKMKCH